MAREVGVEGKLGGQANVPGAAGTWRDLTDNVNGLAANLTNQVRAIADVATAVTKGDLTRYVEVEAKGEVAELKDNVNEMIRNLRETTRQNAEQDWLKSNLAKFNRLLQGQRDLAAVSKMVLSELAPLINAQHGVFYMMNESPPDPAKLKLLSAYAYKGNINVNDEWRLGEGPCRAMRLREATHPADRCTRQLRRDFIGTGCGRPAEYHRVADPVREQGQGRRRNGFVHALQHHSSNLP